jgi:hypothetical protein
MRPFVLLLFPLALLAQPVVTLTGPATVPAGKPATLTVSVSGTAGSSLAALQASIAASNGTLGAPTAIPSAYGAYCNTSVCLAVSCTVAGICTLASLSDGAVFSVPITFPTMTTSAVPVTLSGLLGASTVGASVTLSAGTAYSITVGPSACSVLGQATVTAADALALIKALIGTGICPASFAAGCSLDSLQAVIIAATGGKCIL